MLTEAIPHETSGVGQVPPRRVFLCLFYFLSISPPHHCLKCLSFLWVTPVFLAEGNEEGVGVPSLPSQGAQRLVELQTLLGPEQEHPCSSEAPISCTRMNTCAALRALQTKTSSFLSGHSSGSNYLSVPCATGLIIPASKAAFSITCDGKINAFKRHDGPCVWPF